jgi:hypothetical protein
MIPTTTQIEARLAAFPAAQPSAFGQVFAEYEGKIVPPNKVTLSEYLGEAQRLIQSFAADGMQLTNYRNALNQHFVIGHFTDIRDLAYPRLLDSYSPSLFGESAEKTAMAQNTGESAAGIPKDYAMPFDDAPRKLFYRIMRSANAVSARITPDGIRLRCAQYQTFTTISILMGEFQDQAIAMILIPHAAYKTKDQA